MDVTNATRPTVPECRSPDPDWHFGHARGQPAPCQPEAVPTMRATHRTPGNAGSTLCLGRWPLDGAPLCKGTTLPPRRRGQHGATPGAPLPARAHAPRLRANTVLCKRRVRNGGGGGEHGGPGGETGLEHRPLLLTHGRCEPPGSARREQHAEGWCQFKCIEHQKNAPDQGFRLVQHISTQPN